MEAKPLQAERVPLLNSSFAPFTASIFSFFSFLSLSAFFYCFLSRPVVSLFTLFFFFFPCFPRFSPVMTFGCSFHGKRVAALLFFVCISVLFLVQRPSSGARHCQTPRSVDTSRAYTSSSGHGSLFSSSFVSSWRGAGSLSSDSVYLDLNMLNATASAASNQERVLVLTPLLRTDAINHLDRYFELLDQSTYPNKLISIALLVSTRNDDDPLLQSVQHMIQRLERRWFHAFHDITVYNKDFLYDFNTNIDNGKFELQPYRRSMMARARNYLLSAALEPDHSWV